MKKFFKGFFIQLIINIIAHFIRIIIAFLIIKYAPEPVEPTSFAKDSGWQILALLSIITYNIISIVISFMVLRKKDIKLFFGFAAISLINIYYILNFFIK